MIKAIKKENVSLSKSETRKSGPPLRKISVKELWEWDAEQKNGRIDLTAQRSENDFSSKKDQKQDNAYDVSPLKKVSLVELKTEKMVSVKDLMSTSASSILKASCGPNVETNSHSSALVEGVKLENVSRLDKQIAEKEKVNEKSLQE